MNVVNKLKGERMRNLTKTIVAVSIMTSTSAYSLGIGEIKLHSALNQNLDAEIALFASAGESVSNIQVKLAPPAKFDAAGVPWSYFLSKIRFTPLTKSDGSIVVKLSSSEALKEPFLNFLLEVSWPNGNQYREFTVLVDPPTSYKRKILPIPAPLESKQPEARIVTPEDYNRPKPVIANPAQETEDNAVVAAEPITEYGPVRKSDTLWSIANKVRPSDVTAAQMAFAIYEANPGAFAKPNMNTLLSGETLTIPAPDVALQTPSRKALAEFKRHRTIFRQETRQAEAEKSAAARPPVSVSPKVKTEQEQPVDASKTSVAEIPATPAADQSKPDAAAKQQTETNPAVEAVAKPAQQLKLEPPTESVTVDKDAATGNNPYAGQVDPAVTALSAARKQELVKEEQEFEQRFQRIEQQLVAMQKLLEIKNEQLANLQNGKAPLPIDITAKALPLEASSVIQPAAESTSPPPSASKPVIQPSKPVVAPPADSFADYYLLGGGIGAALLGVLGFLWWRKRQEVYEEDLDDMLATSSQMDLMADNDEQFKTVKVDHSAPYDVGMVSESAFLSEFTPSEFDAFDSGQTEIDPISEADVYLAYGRFQQAEDLMRQAITDQPERNECKLKLLEIFYVNENKLAFDNYVQELMQQGKQNEPAFWNKVVEMANVLTPGTEVLLKPVSAAVNLAQAARDPLDFDVSTFSATDSAPAYTDTETPVVTSAPKVVSFIKEEEQLEPEKNNSSLDFDIKSLTQDKKLSLAEEKQDNLDSNTLDFDLGLFLAKNDGDSTAPMDDVPVKESNFLDFNLDQFEINKAQDESSATPDVVSADEQSIAFDLDTLGATENEIRFEEGLSFSEDSTFEPLDFDFDGLNNSALSAEAGRLDSAQSQDTESLSSKQDQDANAMADLSDDSSFTSFELNDFEALSKSNEAHETIELNMDNDAETSMPVELENFEFDFSLDDFAENSSTPAYDLPSEQELGDFDFSLETMLGGEKTDVAPAKAKEAERFDFDFSLPETESDAKPTTTAKAFSVDDLTDGSGALDAKINLANAYIDMGDIDAAREIAELLLKGSKEHKQAGREILAKIS